ncbi:proline--tRNA ligase, partial [bacterium]|nr:proline--tRNA ligase [bacterium]
ETPKDAEVISHQLMIRAGMIRKVAAGIYTLLPLGLRVIRKFESIVREEMDRSGAQEVAMPSVIPAELWQESGRWDHYGAELLRIKDRQGNSFCYGPTHEEVITDLVKQSVQSYRELPINLYQIQTKFRDEVRPRFGLMRGREFTMKDAYSFHSSWDSLDATYDSMRDTYHRIFERCGLKFKMVEADSGAIGGNVSAEFMVLANTGEDAVISCTTCGYAANVEAAEVVVSSNDSDRAVEALTYVPTPGKKSVDQIADFLSVSTSDILKSMIYAVDDQTVCIVVPGDREVNEIKLRKLLQAEQVRLVDPAEVARRLPGIHPGYIGPVSIDIPIILDKSVGKNRGYIVGANRVSEHIINVCPSRDFQATHVGDVVNAIESDRCPRCPTGHLAIYRGIETGHIFKLGTKYSEAMSCTYKSDDGTDQPMIMGCYGIGIGRTVAASIEQNHDNAGIIWPDALAPFDVSIILTNPSDQALLDVATRLYTQLSQRYDVLFDNRVESAGVKFKDHDLIGIPTQIIIGKKWTSDQKIEIKRRRNRDVTWLDVDGVDEFLSRL